MAITKKLTKLMEQGLKAVEKRFGDTKDKNPESHYIASTDNNGYRIHTNRGNLWAWRCDCGRLWCLDYARYPEHEVKSNYLGDAFEYSTENIWGVTPEECLQKFVNRLNTMELYKIELERI